MLLLVLFQSTHPQGCDSGCGRSARGACRFNPRTRKGATMHTPRPGPGRSVSIHAPARVRPDSFMRSRLVACFNPRTRKGATGNAAQMSTGLQFQSTHPQGCDRQDVGVIGLGGVSIHAPARVRPLMGLMDDAGVPVSIHAPARVRLTSWSRISRRPGFNPRTRKGATCRRHGDGAVRAVSIHAPARVRHGDARRAGRAAGFNPRTRKGATMRHAAGPKVAPFQSTHPQGCDHVRSSHTARPLVSIHAPARVRPTPS